MIQGAFQNLLDERGGTKAVNALSDFFKVQWLTVKVKPSGGNLRKGILTNDAPIGKTSDRNGTQITFLLAIGEFQKSTISYLSYLENAGFGTTRF